MANVYLLDKICAFLGGVHYLLLMSSKLPLCGEDLHLECVCVSQSWPHEIETVTRHSYQHITWRTCASLTLPVLS